jgi:hypothetical protein
VSAPKGICVECGRVVSREQAGVWQVRGFSSDRGASKGGGMNHIREVERIDGRVWHETCWDVWLRRVRGRGIQGAML